MAAPSPAAGASSAADPVHAREAGAADDASPWMPLFFQWPHPHLQVLVVPPPHGPVYTEDGFALDRGAAYLRATLDAIGDWDRAVDLLVAEQPSKAWLRGARWDVWVAPEVPPRVDIAIVFDETMANLLGMAWEVNAAGQHCVVVASQWYLRSFTPADMYNVLVHEFGHCLGLEHAVGVGHDALSAPYLHVPGTTDRLHCPSNLDALGLTMSFGAALGHPSGSKVSVAQYRMYPLRPACEVAPDPDMRWDRDWSPRPDPESSGP